MSGFDLFTMDQLLFAVIGVCAIREVMILTFPNTIAGPGGWLINTEKDS